MLFSPLGNSFVSKYAPKKLLGVLSGRWTFATFIAGKDTDIYAFTLKFDMIKVYYNSSNTICCSDIIILI